MSKLPKIKVVQPFRYPSEEIHDLEQAKYFLFSYGPSVFIVVEGQVINSYDELVLLAAQDCHKDKEFLEVFVETIISGG